MTHSEVPAVFRVRSIGSRASQPWLELVHVGIVVRNDAEAQQARIRAQIGARTYALMWATEAGPRTERTLRSDAENNALVAIRSARGFGFNPWGQLSHPSIPLTQGTTYVADGQLLVHQQVGPDWQLRAGRHRIAITVTWERGQSSSQAFDLVIPPSTAIPVSLIEA